MRYDEVSIYGVDADGNRRVVKVAADGSLSVSGGGGDASAANQIAIRDRLMPSAITTSYLGTSNGANLKPSAGNVFAFTCSNANTAIRYFQLFEKATAPALNDVPVRSFPIYPSDGLLLIGQDIIGGTGVALATGISWGFSSTRLTYTAATVTDCIATVRWS